MDDIILSFIFKGQEIKIQCKGNENMNDILKRYANKINNDINDIYFIHNGNVINNNLKLNEIRNKENEMSILVYNYNNNNYEEKIENESRDIICPICGENCLFEIKDYKINLSKCDNKHNENNILLEEYYKTQIINEVKCNNCNKNKSEIYKNQIYKCCNCNINLCPLCKLNHNKEHIIIDYELKNYICKIHGERFASYCKECEKNMCDMCELEHNKNHNLIYHKDIIKNEKNEKNNIDELKIKIDDLKNEIEEIKNILNKIINNIDIYYNINKNIINNYRNIRNRNYQILININNINKYNGNIINDINKIINESNINDKFKNLYDIYNKMIIVNITKTYKCGKYVGELKNDKREGKGTMYYNNGEKYEGDWKNDINEGKGIYYFKSGNRYEGDFKNDKREGKGIYYGKNGDRYVGDYKNDKKEGKGIYYVKNGDRYEGDYKNDKREGKGIYYGKNGNRYEGEYKNGKPEVKGIYYFNNGDREMGDYIEGKKIGKHVTLHANGDITTKEY